MGDFAYSQKKKSPLDIFKDLASKGKSALPAYNKHEKKSLDNNKKSVTNNKMTNADDKKAVADDKKAVADDKKAVADDKKAVADNKKTVSDDKRNAHDNKKFQEKKYVASLFDDEDEVKLSVEKNDHSNEKKESENKPSTKVQQNSPVKKELMVGSRSTSNDNKDSKDQVLRSGTKKDLDTKSSNKKKDAEREDSKLEKARKSTIKLIQMADSKNLAKIDKLFRDLFESSREKEEKVTKKDEKPSTEISQEMNGPTEEQNLYKQQQQQQQLEINGPSNDKKDSHLSMDQLFKKLYQQQKLLLDAMSRQHNKAMNGFNDQSSQKFNQGERFGNDATNRIHQQKQKDPRYYNFKSVNA